jgi:hypothetical protein
MNSLAAAAACVAVRLVLSIVFIIGWGLRYERTAERGGKR